MQQLPLTQKQIRYLVVGVIIVLVGLAVYYIATHGRLVVENLGDKEITLTSLEDNGLVTETSVVHTGAFVKSGEYVISNKTEGYSRLARVAVKGWLGTTTIELKPIETANINRAAALTYENFFQADDQTLVSLTNLSNYASGYTIHKNDDAFGGSYTDVPFPSVLKTVGIMKNGQLIGLNGESVVQTYSFGSRAFTNIATIQEIIEHEEHEEHQDSHSGTSVLTPTIKRPSDVNSEMASLYLPKTRALYAINPQSKQTQQFTLPLSPNDNAVFDVTDKSYAYVESPIDTEERSRSKEDEERNLTFKATVRPFSGEDRVSVDLGSAKSVSAIALSPSGEYLAAIKNSRLWIYRVKDNSVVMADILHPTTQLFWNGTKLYRLTVEQGLAVFDTTSQQLIPIKVSGFGSLSYSVATPIGSRIYLSAFNDNEESELADGYIIDLASADNGITEHLSKKLPYAEDSYEITYLNNTIYIRSEYLPRSANDPYLTEIKNNARTKLSELIDKEILAKCQVVFVN